MGRVLFRWPSVWILGTRTLWRNNSVGECPDWCYMEITLYASPVDRSQSNQTDYYRYHCRALVSRSDRRWSDLWRADTLCFDIMLLVVFKMTRAPQILGRNRRNASHCIVLEHQAIQLGSLLQVYSEALLDWKYTC
jgi:hypothetical protein